MSRDVVVTSENAGFSQNISIGRRRFQADEPVEVHEPFDYARNVGSSLLDNDTGDAFVSDHVGWTLAKSLSCGSQSKGKTCVQLNLTRSANSGKYSADVAGEITRCVFEHGVSISSKGKGTLCVAWDCKIGAIEQIVSFRSKGKLRGLR